MQVYFDYPYSLRQAIAFMAARDKQTAEQGAVLNATPYSLEMYHRNFKTRQINIIFISNDELSLFSLQSPSCKCPSVCIDGFNFSDSIDELTKVEIEPSADAEQHFELPINLDELKKEMDKARKTTKGCAWRVNPNDRYLLDIKMETDHDDIDWNNSVSIRHFNNKIENYDFSIYELVDSSDTHCKVNINQFIAVFQDYCKLKVSSLRIDIVDGGLILRPQINIDKDAKIGNIKSEQSAHHCLLIEEQIKAFKGLNAIAPNSIVKIYYNTISHPFLVFIFHIGYYGFMHTIFPCYESV